MATTPSTSSPMPVPRRNRAWLSSLGDTRHSLLSRLRKHDDQDAWQRFFDTYAAVIHACARRAGLSAVESDETLQETLLSVAKEMPGFRYDPVQGSFKGWLFKITRRRIADQFRRRARDAGNRGVASGLIEDVPDPAVDPLNQLWEQEWQQNQFQLAAERVRDKVSARQWQMFDLVALKGWPIERVSATLGVNRAQIYMAKMRVGRALKDQVRALNLEGP